MTQSRALDSLIEAARTPLSSWSDRYPYHRPMGTMCSYVPEEMLHAAGYTPVRLRGAPTPLRQADAHLQSFTCALCRSTLDQLLGGELGMLAGTVFSHTCDTMQALADLWKANSQPGHFIDCIMQPANLGASAALDYLISELRRFREQLAAFSGHPADDAALRASIAQYDETRRLVRTLQADRGRLPTSAYFAILDSAQRMPRERFNPILGELLAEVEAFPEVASGPRLFLVGAVLDEPRLLELIEEQSAQVAGDDLCSASRHFLDQVGTDGDPVENLADYFLRRPPCPTKFRPDHDSI